MTKNNKKSDPSKRGLTLLGRTTAKSPTEPAVGILETFENLYQIREYTVEFECSDFTSLCPITGQPDFATVHIEYVPSEQCIETKSLKFYLSSYRATASFNEEIINRILDHLVAACDPRAMMVRGEFASRGGITVRVEAHYPG